MSSVSKHVRAAQLIQERPVLHEFRIRSERLGFWPGCLLPADFSSARQVVTP